MPTEDTRPAMYLEPGPLPWKRQEWYHYSLDNNQKPCDNGSHDDPINQIIR